MFDHRKEITEVDSVFVHTRDIIDVDINFEDQRTNYFSLVIIGSQLAIYAKLRDNIAFIQSTS